MRSRDCNYKDASDEELAALASRDRLAFAEIYERYVDRVYSYALYQTGKAADAQDIVSQAFLKALEHIGSYRGRGGGLAAWLFRIARNLIIDGLRKQGRITLYPDSDGVSSESPEQIAAANDQARYLRQLVAQLPSAQREVIILKFTLGLTNKEIARITGRSETAISSLQYRAIKNLRNEVEDK